MDTVDKHKINFNCEDKPFAQELGIVKSSILNFNKDILCDYIKDSDKKINIIFLDIDGVVYPGKKESIHQRIIGSKNFWNMCDDKNLDNLCREKFGSSLYDVNATICFDKEAVSRLLKLCDYCQAYIVLSSAWRSRSLQHIRNLFSLQGFGHLIIDKTRLEGSGGRECEIFDWLQENRNIVNSFVILDDCDGYISRMFKYEFVECEYKSGFTDNLYVKATEILQQPNNLHETEAYKTWVNIQKDNWIKPVVLNVANISTIARARQKNLNYAEFITEVCTQIKNSATCQEIIFEDLNYGLGGLEISEDLIVDSICNSLETNKAIKIISITACPIKNVKKLLNLLSDNYTLSKLILDNNDFSYQQHQEIQAFIKTCKYPLILSLREKNELIPMSLIEEAQKNSNIRLCLNSTQLQSCFSEEYEENGRLKGCDITYLQRKQFYF